MATPATSPELCTVDANDGAKECVECHTRKPADGRLLRCLHIICGSCLSDVVTGSGCVKCVMCGQITSPRLPGVDLGRQLVESRPLLYPCSSAEAKGNGRSSRQPECELCDDDAANPATHECASCNGALLCDACAAGHSKKRLFRGHQVRKLEEAGKEENQDGSTSCMLHSKQKVTVFCQTCGHVVCDQCTAYAHLNHDLVSLADAAERQRQSLSALLNEPPNRQDNPGYRCKALINEIDGGMTSLKTEVETASAMINTVFDRIEAALNQEKYTLLRAVDFEYWDEQKRLKKQKTDLQQMAAQLSLAENLAKTLSDAGSSDSLAAQLGSLVEENFKLLGENILTKTDIKKHRSILAMATGKAVDQAVDALGKVVALCKEETRADLTKSEIVLAQQISVSQPTLAHLKLRCELGTRLVAGECQSCIQVKLITPTSSMLIAPVHSSQDDEPGPASIGGVLDTPGIPFPVTISESGQHQLEISAHGVTKTIAFEGIGPIRMDPDKCSSRIMVTDDGRKVSYTSTDQRQFSNVLSTVGISSGVHSWKVRVFGTEIGSGGYGLGVSTLPATDGYREAVHLGKTGYYWWSDSHTHGLAAGQRDAAKTSPWENGDLITFTLDCDAKSVQLYLHRTGETKTLTGVDGDGKPLYFYACLCRPNRSLEICDAH